MTAQNTKGVSAILETDADFLGEELDAVFEDIFPDAVKIGMAASKRIIEKTADKLSFYNAKKHSNLFIYFFSSIQIRTNQ